MTTSAAQMETLLWPRFLATHPMVCLAFKSCNFNQLEPQEGSRELTECCTRLLPMTYAAAGPWAGSCLTTGDADWVLYVPTHRDRATGVVLAEVRTTAPRPR